MSSRWDVERAAKASPDLRPASMLVLLVLATRADADTAVIPPKWTPSITELVRETKLSRSTVCVHLDRLERAGWLVRKRPSPVDQRVRHARTRYALKIPKLVRQRAVASPGHASELVRQEVKASPATGRKKNNLNQYQPARENAREEEVLSAITETFREIAPAAPETHTREWAVRTAQTIPGGRDRARYVPEVIRRNPAAYLPTQTPTPVRDLIQAMKRHKEMQ